MWLLAALLLVGCSATEAPPAPPPLPALAPPTPAPMIGPAPPPLPYAEPRPRYSAKSYRYAKVRQHCTIKTRTINQAGKKRTAKYRVCRQ